MISEADVLHYVATRGVAELEKALRERGILVAAAHHEQPLVQMLLDERFSSRAIVAAGTPLIQRGIPGVIDLDTFERLSPFRISPAALSQALKTHSLGDVAPAASPAVPESRPSRQAASTIVSAVQFAGRVLRRRMRGTEVCSDFAGELAQLVAAMDAARALIGLEPLFYPLGPRTKEGSPGNLERRAEFDRTARKYDKSTSWADYAFKPPFGVGEKKCSQFIFDVTKEAGAPAHIDGYLAVAIDWANPKVRIPKWRPLAWWEKPEPGDVAAFPVPGGGGLFTGHVGFIVSDGQGGTTNVSSHADAIYGKPGQFTKERGLTFRRYTAE